MRKPTLAAAKESFMVGKKLLTKLEVKGVSRPPFRYSLQTAPSYVTAA
jgi:hypothetical protein